MQLLEQRNARAGMARDADHNAYGPSRDQCRSRLVRSVVVTVPYQRAQCPERLAASFSARLRPSSVDSWSSWRRKAESHQARAIPARSGRPMEASWPPESMWQPLLERYAHAGTRRARPRS